MIIPVFFSFDSYYSSLSWIRLALTVYFLVCCFPPCDEFLHLRFVFMERWIVICVLIFFCRYFIYQIIRLGMIAKLDFFIDFLFVIVRYILLSIQLFGLVLVIVLLSMNIFSTLLTQIHWIGHMSLCNIDLL